LTLPESSYHNIRTFRAVMTRIKENQATAAHIPGRIICLAVIIGALLASAAWGADPPPPAAGNLPMISIAMDKAKGPEDVSVVIQIFAALTLLSIAPAILIMLTSFTRFIIVFSLLRQAMGTQQMPPNQILVGLAMFLTFYVMSPVWQDVNQNAVQPYLEKKISSEQAVNTALTPIRKFMYKQIREKDLALFVEIAGLKRPDTPADVPTMVMIPSFIISELKTAFELGFLLFIPFLIIDMVVASVLLSMGMMMLPPIMISLPFKLLLFVLVDGWHLIVGSLVKGFL
jgi:flagellar biosynthesis protein FliP